MGTAPGGSPGHGTLAKPFLFLLSIFCLCGSTVAMAIKVPISHPCHTQQVLASAQFFNQVIEYTA